MPSQRTIILAVGTRPEAIKVAPLVSCLRENGFAAILVTSGQHATLAAEQLRHFGLEADICLSHAPPGPGLNNQLGSLIIDIGNELVKHPACAVVAQGDTSTVAATALAAFTRKIPFIHLEAGLRSNDLDDPHPEEGFRRLVAPIATLNLCPTESARQSLLAEGINSDRCAVVGNTVIDALMFTSGRIQQSIDRNGEHFTCCVTLHRKEIQGTNLPAVIEALLGLANNHPQLRFRWPVHPNPAIKDLVFRRLEGHPQFTLMPPLGYSEMVRLIMESDVIITDSGGLQEEGPALGVPVIVIRDTTERPEAVAAGGAVLVGYSSEALQLEASRLLEDPSYYAERSRPIFPYGRGDASIQCVRHIRSCLAPQ